MLTCQYCQSFQYSPTRMPKTGERFCGTIFKFVGAGTKSCPDIHPSTIFWCRKNSQWYDISICINRKRNGLDSKCTHCGQYSSVIDLYRLTKIKNGKNGNSVPTITPIPITKETIVLKPIVKGE